MNDKKLLQAPWDTQLSRCPTRRTAPNRAFHAAGYGFDLVDGPAGAVGVRPGLPSSPTKNGDRGHEPRWRSLPSVVVSLEAHVRKG